MFFLGLLKGLSKSLYFLILNHVIFALYFLTFGCQGEVLIYIFIIHFLTDKRESYHVIIKVFETSNTSRYVMSLKMNSVLRKYELIVCVLAYVKDERNNLSTMNYALIYVLFCEVLGLLPDY